MRTFKNKEGYVKVTLFASAKSYLVLTGYPYEKDEIYENKETTKFVAPPFENFDPEVLQKIKKCMNGHAFSSKDIGLKMEKISSQKLIKDKKPESFFGFIKDNSSMINKREIREAFVQTEHSLEFTSEVKGVKFIDDSMACSLNKVWFSVEQQSIPVILITGLAIESEKELNAVKSLAEKIKVIIFIGNHNTDYKISRVSPTRHAEDIAEAVKLSLQLSLDGDVVLFSPGCPDFCRYNSIEEISAEFKKTVLALE